MASEHTADGEQTKPLEEKIADLSLQETEGLVADAVRENLDGGKGAPDGSTDQVLKEGSGGTEKDCEGPKDGEQEPTSREVLIAHKEVQKSPDEEVHATPTVDHRSIVQPGGEEKRVDVPTAVVHESADSGDKPQQQGKGLIQSVTGKITNSVKSVFSGFAGSKAGKNPEAKTNET